MSVIIKGGISNQLADVDSNNNLKVTLPTVLSASGYASMVSEVDDGSVIGSKTLRQLDTSFDYRLRVGVDKILWQGTFNYAILNTSRYLGVTSTMTVTVAGGFLNLNAGNAVASGNVARVQTYRTFTTYASYPTYFDIKAKFSAAFQANNVIEFGMGIAATTATPTDGVFFRVTGGVLYGVTNNGGAEQTVNLNYTNIIGNVDHFLIVLGLDRVEFWINDILCGVIETSASLGAPTLSNALPILLRNYNSGVVSTAIQLNVGQIAISSGDMDMGKDWATNMVTNGLSCISAPDGATAAQTANYANNGAPATAVLSNTVASYGATLLGGQFQFGASAGTETDYTLFAYLNPAATAAIPGKNLIISGVRISTVASVAAVGATPTVLQWSVGAGSTAVTLVTADSATAGTRGARRLPLGIQSVLSGSPIGTMFSPEIDVDFLTPISVEPGTYFQIILKIPVGVATVSQIFRGICMVNGYFE